MNQTNEKEVDPKKKNMKKAQFFGYQVPYGTQSSSISVFYNMFTLLIVNKV